MIRCNPFSARLLVFCNRPSDPERAGLMLTEALVAELKEDEKKMPTGGAGGPGGMGGMY